MLALQSAEIMLITAIKGFGIHPFGLIVLSIGGLLSLLFQIYFFTILIQVVLSWVAPSGHNPAISLLYNLNEPLLRRARRILPAIHGFDFSPILIMIILQLLTYPDNDYSAITHHCPCRAHQRPRNEPVIGLNSTSDWYQWEGDNLLVSVRVQAGTLSRR
jgi:uncharacterized protein YggT (Ycf19 family)